MEDRVKVQRDTIQIFHNKWYINQKDELININETDIINSIKKTTKYYKNDLVKLYENSGLLTYITTNIFIVQDDCLEIGLLLKDLGYNPVVLNMANAFNPGGGYKTGESAQEESLFRRTNLHLCLDSQRNKLYPIPTRGCIYSPDVIVVKHSEFENYRVLEIPKKISFISSAAHRCKMDDTIKVDDTKVLKEEINIITKAKIESIFELAAVKHHDVIILSAYGCGAFGNPPVCIAKLFKDAIQKYKKHFRHILFAIFDDKNALSNNKNGNVKIFSDILELPVMTYIDLVNNIV